MQRLIWLCGIAAIVCAAGPAQAGALWPCFDTPDWCARDAIYHEFRLIARLEADPDVDEAIKGPAITAARAEIHRLRATIKAPPPSDWATIASPPRAAEAPCCYSREPVRIR